MSHQVVWEKCSVDNPDTGESVVLVRGDTVPDWVAPFPLFVLTSTGAVRVVDEPDPTLGQPTPEPVRLAEHPPPPAGPAAGGEVIENVEVGAGAVVVAAKDRPADSASKADWVEYAVSRGADRQTVEPVTRAELISRYGS